MSWEGYDNSVMKTLWGVCKDVSDTYSYNLLPIQITMPQRPQTVNSWSSLIILVMDIAPNPDMAFYATGTGQVSCVAKKAGLATGATQNLMQPLVMAGNYRKALENIEISLQSYSGAPSNFVTIFCSDMNLILIDGDMASALTSGLHWVTMGFTFKVWGNYGS